MNTAADPLGQLRRALDAGNIDQATFDAAAAGLRAAASAGAGYRADAAGGAAIAQGPGAIAAAPHAAVVQGDVSGMLNLGVIIEQARQPGAGADALRRAYLARLLAQTNQLPLLAGEPGSERVQLSSVYTALLTQRSEGDAGHGRSAGAAAPPGEREARPLSALAVLDVEPRLVLMAGPGGGKSTFVNVVAMSLAGEGLGLPVTAEGVETPSVLAALQQFGSLKAQGFLYGKPGPADAVYAELEQLDLVMQSADKAVYDNDEPETRQARRA